MNKSFEYDTSDFDLPLSRSRSKNKILSKSKSKPKSKSGSFRFSSYTSSPQQSRSRSSPSVKRAINRRSRSMSKRRSKSKSKSKGKTIIAPRLTIQKPGEGSRDTIGSVQDLEYIDMETQDPMTLNSERTIQDIIEMLNELEVINNMRIDYCVPQTVYGKEKLVEINYLVNQLDRVINELQGKLHYEQYKIHRIKNQNPLMDGKK